MNNITIVQKCIVKNNGKVLILRRSMDSRRHPGMWDFAGGKLEYGEDLIQSLKREIKEETGLDVHDIKILCIFSEMDDDGFRIRIGYYCNADSDSVALSEEHTELKWISADELSRMEISPGNERIVEEWIRAKK